MPCRLLWVHWEFLPTPSARRATHRPARRPRSGDISTHALREEGDGLSPASSAGHQGLFLPTPSARRATIGHLPNKSLMVISTHALREEGDFNRQEVVAQRDHISTHALREEGDRSGQCSRCRRHYFYPRPPRGGRHLPPHVLAVDDDFYPRPPRGGRRRKAPG